MRLRRVLHAFTAALIASAALVAVTPSAGQAAGYGLLENLKRTENGAVMYLSIRGGSGAGAGADAIMFWQSFNEGGTGVADQLWTQQPVGVSNYVYLRNPASPFALSVQGNGHTNGTKVIQWWFDEDNEYEQWAPIYYGDVRGFRNVGAENMCLAVAGGGNAYIVPRAQVIIWNCLGGGDDQRWYPYAR
ncbi:RICIN domain-containing protein [Actinoplanes flavus]|uniref:RICIN domain-containing protein n=1 Tax=Actinoplanes flavus TaxID=2820290 RepID=A0ABS3UZA3_9ACTN|nr:RICIN domain-containing protein [Actinoplanes flavus]MBO3743904.1 RICIN domain-containing protein [Actinoplanes flavus]